MSRNNFRDYYVSQAGSGVSHVYGGVGHQRGHGIGSFLGGLFRRALPFLKSGLKVVGREAAKTGVGVLGDVLNDVPIKTAFHDRFEVAKTNLKRKAQEKLENIMSGSGYKKKRRRTKVSQSRKSRRRVRSRKIINRKKRSCGRKPNRRGRKRRGLSVGRDIFS